jgi:hypothetical protein
VTTISRRLVAVLVDLVGPIVQAFSGESRPWRVIRGLIATGARPRYLDSRRAPVRHEGATERFGTELRALRSVEVSPELISDIETELRWGLTWYEFERNMQDEIDRVFAPFLPVAECRDFDELRDQMGLRELVPA